METILPQFSVEYPVSSDFDILCGSIISTFILYSLDPLLEAEHPSGAQAECMQGLFQPIAEIETLLFVHCC